MQNILLLQFVFQIKPLSSWEKSLSDFNIMMCCCASTTFMDLLRWLCSDESFKLTSPSVNAFLCRLTSGLRAVEEPVVSSNVYCVIT